MRYGEKSGGRIPLRGNDDRVDFVVKVSAIKTNPVLPAWRGQDRDQWGNLRTVRLADRKRVRSAECVIGYQAPATVMLPIRMEPVAFVPRTSTSLPMAAMSRNMSFRLPAMVISSTGYWMMPFSTQ